MNTLLPKCAIIHVELKVPYDGQTNYYFGSLAAIYDVIPASVLGASKHQLWRAKITRETPYISDTCTISKNTLFRKKQKKQSC